MKDLYTGSYKMWLKKLRKTQINKKIHHIHGLEDLKWTDLKANQYNPKGDTSRYSADTEKLILSHKEMQRVKKNQDKL